MQPALTGMGPNLSHNSYDLSNLDLDMSFPWYTQASSNAELLDAAGGIMIQSFPENPESYYENDCWLLG